MKKEWKDWFISQLDVKPHTYINKPDNLELSRRYSFIELFDEDIPFSTELQNYIANFIDRDDYKYNGYAVIKYDEGDYIGEHADYTNDTFLTYSYELQESDCKTKVIVDGKAEDEVWYFSDVKHSVDKIKKGTRISLIMFAQRKTEVKTIL